MEYSVELDDFEKTPRDVVVTIYKSDPNTIFPFHKHNRGQFVFASAGSVLVYTEGESWIIPPQCAIWLPAGVGHEMHMRGGAVNIFNTYIYSIAAERVGLSKSCQVLSVSPLLKNLLCVASDLPKLYSEQREQRIMDLILDEIAAMHPMNLNVPLPTEPRLARVCHWMLENPSLNISIDQAASMAGMSRSTFTRQFRYYTSVSFVEWRRQVCLLVSLSRLYTGESVTSIALDLGFSSSSAFTTIFRRLLGNTPSTYFTDYV